MAKKYVYFFEEGNAQMKNLLGGKGANLCEMKRIGIPVPEGFVITTEACREFFTKNDFPDGLWEQVLSAMGELERRTGKKFGSVENPLLVSVRSGAPISMPGMMDTILNLGLNDQSVEGLAKGTNNPRFAYDSYRRLIQMFGNVVLGIEHSEFEEQLDKIKEKYNAKEDVDLDVHALKEAVEVFKGVVKKHGTEFPQDPYEQLRLAIRAVFES